MDTKIQIKDRFFTPYISREKIAEAVARVAAQMNEDLAGKNPLFLCVLNGAFVFKSVFYCGLCHCSGIDGVRFHLSF